MHIDPGPIGTVTCRKKKVMSAWKDHNGVTTIRTFRT
jgi:hypothetical protein